MNIFTYEVKKYARSGLIWGLGLALLTMMFMAVYPAFGSDAQIMEKILENYPPEMLKAFGMSNSLTLSSVLGFFGFVFVFIQLFIAIQSSNYGFGMLSVEERELTADFLLSKPVSRSSIIISKFLAVVVGLLITNAILIAGSLYALSVFHDGNPYDMNKLYLMFATLVPFQLFFVSIGMVTTVFLRKVRSVLSFSIGLSFMLYILNALRAIIGGELLGVISPFYYFEANYVLDKGELKPIYTAVALGIIAISLAVTFVRYIKRDIHSL